MVSPERAPYLLIDRLAENCSVLFTMETLVSAVTQSYSFGEAELGLLVRKVACAVGALQESSLPGMVHDGRGQRYLVHTGTDPLVPENFIVRMTPHLPALPVRDVLSTRRLAFGGRYDGVTGIAPGNMEHVLDGMLTSTISMLEALQRWIENRLYATLEEFGESLADGVYGLLDELDGADGLNRRVDVAIVGRRRGWRIPSPQLLERAMPALRGSKGRHEADVLAATFVSTIMPRKDLLMAKALEAHSAIVLPFKNAPYVLAGSYFGLACQLLDGKETDRIHPVYDSDAVGVVLIYPAADVELQRLVEARAAELQAFVRSNLRPFVQALAFIERDSPARATGDAEGAGARLMEVLDEVMEANRDRAELRRVSLSKLRAKLRGRRRGGRST